MQVYYIDGFIGEDEFLVVQVFMVMVLDECDLNQFLIWGYVGCNEFCFCGLGKKYKYCYGVLNV